MALHYFHCSDGVDLVIDRAGRDLSGSRNVSRAAADAAFAMMGSLPAYDEWESWSVYIYDRFGEVGIVPFPVCDRMAA